jgi:hydrogenase maturation protease
MAARLRGPHRRHSQPGRHATSVVIIGVGNDFRRDDGAGLAAVRELRGSAPRNVTIVELEGEATTLIEAWSGCHLAIVVDAVKGGNDAGHVYRFDALAERLPAALFPCSTHAFGISAAIELARALGRLPGRLVIYGIEGHSFNRGRGLTENVGRAVEEAAARILREVQG